MMVNCDESYIDVEGETKRCSKVMAFKMDWVDMYWTEPIQVRLCAKVMCQGHGLNDGVGRHVLDWCRIFIFYPQTLPMWFMIRVIHMFHRQVEHMFGK